MLGVSLCHQLRPTIVAPSEPFPFKVGNSHKQMTLVLGGSLVRLSF
jgi:hypothetical protein|eukprot:COSAG06_NODE_3094_length_5868_cov_3.751777_1_plen_46_part_00